MCGPPQQMWWDTGHKRWFILAALSTLRAQPTGCRGTLGQKLLKGSSCMHVWFQYIFYFFQECLRIHPGKIHWEGACLGEFFSAAIMQALRSGLGVLVSLPLISHFCLCSWGTPSYHEAHLTYDLRKIFFFQLSRGERPGQYPTTNLASTVFWS